MSDLVNLRRTDPNCGYEQSCSCATWVPGRGWVSDMLLLYEAKKLRKRGRK
jgi:hypothetical protein